ncbi:MAG TPA: tetratricopeptide repeat protein [Terracidiphilus sp.]
MASPSTSTTRAGLRLRSEHVYLIAALCMATGLAIGYLARGSRMPAAAVQARAVMPHPPMSGRRPSLEEMKHMADKQAAPVLAQLAKDPNNTDLLVQVGGIYHGAHQFTQAANYYDRAVMTKPADVAIRSKLAASLYRMGEADKAIDQLNQALGYSPTDANALFNLGIIEWQGKQDAKSALSAWQKLLKTNPQLPAERKAQVQKLMADVKASTAGASGR